MADIITDRVRIIEAAERLFYGRGIQSVGMDAVRAEAGVPLKRLYAAFPSKDALIIEVMRYQTGIWDSGIAGAAAAATTPTDKLLAIFDFLDVWFRADDFRGCGFINAFGELGGSSPDVAKVAHDQKAAFQQYVSELVQQLGAPPVLASQLALLAEGAQTTAAISGNPDAAVHARAAAQTLIDAALA